MKILFVATVVKKHIMEFHIPYLKMLKEMGWETAVAAKNDYANPAECNIPFCDTYYNIPFERKPLYPQNIKAYYALKKIIDNNDYDIIHCHTPVGGFLARLAAMKARKTKTKVIYTAHGFHFFKGASFINWLAYYPIERILAHQTDVLITINKEDFNNAKQFKAGKVVYVPGVGIDIAKNNEITCTPEKKRKELGLQKDDFVLLSVGELISRKNHIAVIKALGRMKQKNILSNIQYVICGSGKLLSKLENKVKCLDLSNHVHFLGYRKDICEIMKCSDLFVFMSLQEGLPVALMEAMSCNLPVICSDIRGNTDLVLNGKNGAIIHNNIFEIEQEIIRLKNDIKLRAYYSNMAKQAVKSYDLNITRNDIRKIYLDCSN